MSLASSWFVSTLHLTSRFEYLSSWLCKDIRHCESVHHLDPCTLINGMETSGHHEAPRIIVHSFETAEGADRPVKSSKPALTSGLATRRGHSKSRGGSARCNQRRVKCDERKPTCSRCTHGEHLCSHPNASNVTKVSILQSPNRHPFPYKDTTVYLSVTSDTFTLSDMRVFHHFRLKVRSSRYN